MKIILSRKGFDSSYGGGASPIMPNGDLLSIPIPANAKEKGIPYAQLHYGKQSYLDIMQALGLKIPEKGLAHFDPDLNVQAFSRNKHWTGIFGQQGAAQTHLKNQEVEKGDIFLFFGSFKRTYEEEGLRFEKDYERHIIFGYLKVGEILIPPININHPIFHQHPHFQNASLYTPRNAVYIAEKTADYGVFKYREELVLTRNGFPKSQWELPLFFHPKYGTQISRHSERDVTLRGDRILLRSRGIGQDFVIQGDKRIGEWAKNLIEQSETF